MAEYKETSVAGTLWNRFSRVVIENPRSGNPYIHCVEQEVLNAGEKEIVRDIGNLGFSFQQDYEFDLLNPLDNTPTGEKAKMSDVYVLVYSCVLSKAKERDAQ